MSNRLKTILIGVFVSLGVLITIFTILFLEPKIGDRKKTYNVRFSNVANISEGTHVTLAGKPVGEVEEIKRVPKSRQGPADELGRVYFYELTLKVDSSVEIYNTDEITIATTGLLGEKSIAIIPKAPAKDQVPKKITNEVIYAQSVEPIENMLYQITQVAEKVETAVNDIDQWFVENQDNLSMAVSAFSEAMKEIEQTIQSVNEQDLIASLRLASDNFTITAQMMQDTIGEMQNSETVMRVNTALDSFADASEVVSTDGKRFLQNANQITQDIAEGKGLLGKLIKDDDLYLRLTAIMSKIDTLMNDINNYGLLFQYDKHWQRLRAKKATLLQALKTPEQFRCYFERELDEITVSLGRISSLLEKAQEEKEREKIMASPSFKRNFSELLYQVKELLNSLKLYNEQLVETLNRQLTDR